MSLMKHFNLKQIPFARAYSRREMLEWMGSAAALTLLGWGWDRSLSGDQLTGLNLQSIADAAITPSCVVRPEQTEGPYFVDEKLNRSDIRSDPSDGSMRQGVPLRLAFQVSRVNGGSCAPFSGARVDVWQCDALGVYSDVRDPNADTRGKKFLRGYQVTNTRGAAEFVTIYPGWYPGRAVHIHFKIRSDTSSRRGFEFTSQLYFDESITDAIYKQAPYNAKGRRATTNENDFGFRRGGKQLMPALTKDAQGYAATFDIGLQIT
jgi:protocatechuate 3,4-dioxygenase beta subunit